MLLPHLRVACAERRERLARALGTSCAMLFAGRSRARNYASNTYAFRASSHFLYFVGLPLEGAGLFVDERRMTLLVPAHGPHDELWHGPVASAAELAQATGLEVLGLSDLPALLSGRIAATVPSFDHTDAREVAAALGRPPDELGMHERDAPLLEAIVALRLAHDEAALAELRSAARATVRAHETGMRRTRAGGHEREVCAAMEASLAAEGFGTAYPSIVSVHGEVLHNHRHEQPLRDGDLLLADVGAETSSGYAADVTRTWPVSGRFSAPQRTLYELVLEMQRSAIARVRPGARYRDVHLTAARTLVDGLVQLGILHGEVDALVEDGVHALFFPHGVGHLLGLDVHDMEDLGDRAGYARGRSRATQFGLSYLRLDRDLEPGMLVTIEPGFYQVPALLRDPRAVGIPDGALDRTRLSAFADVRGIRIEDDVLVTADGCEVLTSELAKTADDVEALVSSA